MRTGIARGSFAVVLMMFVVACDPAPAPNDAGHDAFVAEDTGPVDSGPPPVRCEGTATPCGTLSGAPACATVMGCAFSQCAGFAVPCEDNPTEVICAAEAGCTWSGTECLGTATPCATFTDTDPCSDQSGCTWSTTAQCRGSATACVTFTEATCTTQPGCTLSMP